MSASRHAVAPHFTTITDTPGMALEPPPELVRAEATPASPQSLAAAPSTLAGSVCFGRKITEKPRSALPETDTTADCRMPVRLSIGPEKLGATGVGGAISAGGLIAGGGVRGAAGAIA